MNTYPGHVGIARICCKVCMGFGKSPDSWAIICGYCCGTARIPIPNEEVFPLLRIAWQPEDMLK